MSKTWLNIIYSIGLAILIVTFVNLGISTFYDRPECDYYDKLDCRLDPNGGCSGVNCTLEDGTYTCPAYDYQPCENEQNEYNRNVFYIIGFIGIIAIIIGLFTSGLVPQITGLGSGFVLIIEGMIRNSNSTLTLFITSGLLILVVIYLIYKYNKR